MYQYILVPLKGLWARSVAPYKSTYYYLHCSFPDRVQASPNAVNINMIADLYAEVTGVLAQSRYVQLSHRYPFQVSVRKN